MTVKLDFKQARDAFEAYLDEYDREDEKIKYRVSSLKPEHSSI